MIINYRKKQQRDPRRVWLDDADCERLNRTDYEALRCMLGAVSYLAYARDQLSDEVLERIKAGKPRLRMALGAIKSIVDDIIGTVPVRQCKQLQNTMQDMDMRMVPKITPMSQNVVLEKSIAMELTDMARIQCRECTKNGSESKTCPLYGIMEATTPLEDWGDGILCPYAMADWTD